MYLKWQSYDIWFLRYGVLKTEFFLILDYFLPFEPSSNPKNVNFENMKKMTGDITILHMCAINDNHMMYDSWDTECNGQNFLSVWTVFCTFTLLTTQKIKILKKWKITWRYHHFTHMCTINDNHMMYGSWDMECGRHNFLSFWTIFCPYTPLTTPKIKIFNKWKKKLEISSFYTSLQKSWSCATLFLRLDVWQV